MKFKNKSKRAITHPIYFSLSPPPPSLSFSLAFSSISSIHKFMHIHLFIPYINLKHHDIYMLFLGYVSVCFMLVLNSLRNYSRFLFSLPFFPLFFVSFLPCRWSFMILHKISCDCYIFTCFTRPSLCCEQSIISLFLSSLILWLFIPVFVLSVTDTRKRR